MDTENTREREAYKMELNKRVENLLRSGIPTKDIADILDGEAFLHIEPQRGQQEPVTIFDVRGFVESQLMKGKPMRLPDEVHYLDSTILPPGDGEIVSGSGAGIDAKEIVPRTTYLMELLEEMRFSYTLFSGTHTPGMVRGLDYVGFYIPQIQKLVFVNNEEGNATFVVHTVRDEDDVQLLLSCTKQELRDPNINDFPTDWIPYTAGSSDEWKNVLKEKLLSQPSPDTSVTHELPFKKERSQPYTTDTALAKLEQAFVKWNSLPEQERGRFNTDWLQRNGYTALYKWTRGKGNSSLESLVAQSDVSGLAKSFEKQERHEPYTKETALTKLEEAFDTWRNLPKKTRGEFNPKRLIAEGFSGLLNWSHQKGNLSLESLAAQSDVPGLAQSFERQKKDEPYTKETALAKLEKAFDTWRNLPKEKKGEFNIRWLQNNGFGGLSNWSHQKGNVPIETLASTSTVSGLSKSFKKQQRSQPYTKETALAKLEEAFSEWSKLSEKERGRFRGKWLKTHGYAGLKGWTHKEGNPSLKTLVESSTVPRLSESFKKR